MYGDLCENRKESSTLVGLYDGCIIGRSKSISISDLSQVFSMLLHAFKQIDDAERKGRIRGCNGGCARNTVAVVELN